MNKLEQIINVLNKYGWQTTVKDNNLIFEKVFDDNYKWESSIELKDEGIFAHHMASKVLNYSAEASNAAIIKNSISRFKKNFSGEYDSIDELYDEIKKYGFFFKESTDKRKYYLHLDGIIFGALYEFSFKENVYRKSDLGKKDVNRVVQYLKKYNENSFVNFYVINDQKESENYRYMYNHSESINNEFWKLFREIDEIAYS